MSWLQSLVKKVNGYTQEIVVVKHALILHALVVPDTENVHIISLYCQNNK